MKNQLIKGVSVMRIENNVALIENRLLHDAIWGDVDCIQNNTSRFTGYINANVDMAGRAFIEYCIAKVLGIFRLPQCGYDSYSRGNYNYRYAELDETMVSEACKEMEMVMEHVQKQVQKKALVKDDKVSVVRCLSDFQVNTVARQLQENKTEIAFPVNIFSSYSYDGNINQIYPSGRMDDGTHINIREEVAVEDIILWDEFVGDGFRHCLYERSMHDEERELWVVDRSITGIKKLDKSCFHCKDGIPSIRGESSSRGVFGRDKPVYTRKPVRPCECDDILTKYVMKRNIKKIQKEESIINGIRGEYKK